MNPPYTITARTNVVLADGAELFIPDSRIERSTVHDDARLLRFVIERMPSGGGTATIPPGIFDLDGIAWSSETVKLPLTVAINTRSRRSRILRRVIRAGRRGDLNEAIPTMLGYIERRGARKQGDWTPMSGMTKNGRARRLRQLADAVAGT